MHVYCSCSGKKLTDRSPESRPCHSKCMSTLVCVCVCVSPVYPGEVLQGILKEYQVHSLVVLIVLFKDLQIQYTIFTHNCWCISWIQNACVCY